MKHCLWCMNVIQLDISWRDVLFPPYDSSLCDGCRRQLEYVSVNACQHCHRRSKRTVCRDCERWHTFYNGTDPLSKSVSVFQYNNFLQEVITKWKYRGDYLLGDMFVEEMKAVYVRELQPAIPEDTVVIPIPLSAEREYERAFNQAAQLSGSLPIVKERGMRRTRNEKQSKKSRRDRISAVNPFILTQPINKTVVLVDDIYTTGRTLRHAAELLVASGTPAVYALTLARG